MKSKIVKVYNLFNNRTELVLKFLFIILSGTVVFYAVFLLLDASGLFFSIISGTFNFLIKFALRFFLFLVLHTFPYILPPVVLYLSSCLIIKKQYLRYYIFLLLFSFYIIWFIRFVLKTDLIIIGHLLNLPEILTALIQIYIFILLIIPSYLCSIIASVFFIFKSMLVFVLPDLPFRFDDLGMIISLFLFTFFYLNNIVFLIKTAGKYLLKIDPAVILFKLPGGLFDDKHKK